MIIVLHELSLLFWHFINKIAYHLGLHEPSSPLSWSDPRNKELLKPLELKYLMYTNEAIYVHLFQKTTWTLQGFKLKQQEEIYLGSLCYIEKKENIILAPQTVQKLNERYKMLLYLIPLSYKFDIKI